MLYREEVLGAFEVFNILSLSLIHQHVFCFKSFMTVSRLAVMNPALK